MLFADVSDPVAQAFTIATPAGCGFNQTNAIGNKGIFDELILLFGTLFAETERYIGFGNMAPPFGKAPGEQSKPFANGHF